MRDIIIRVMNDFGYFGIALLIAVENIFPPIPSELILTFGGFMTTRSQMNVWLVSLFATLGSVSGAMFLYGLGRLLSPARLERIVLKYGRWLFVKPQHIEKAERWFSRRGAPTVFFCRFIPIVRSLISIPAGIARMNIGGFLLYTILGTSIWNLLLVTLGAYAGSKWEAIAGYVNTYSYFGLIFLALAAVGAALWFKIKRKEKLPKK